MSDHPENQGKMHELLEAYARKRRAAAGEPSDMHAATRNLLQAEVRKQYPPGQKTSAAGSGPLAGFLALYLPRLALACGVVALLAVGVRYTFRNEQSPTHLASVDRAEPKEMALVPAPAPSVAEPATTLPIAIPAAPAVLADRENELVSATATRKPAEAAARSDFEKLSANSVASVSSPTAPLPPMAPVAQRNDVPLAFSAGAAAPGAAPRDLTVVPRAQTGEGRQLNYAEAAPSSGARFVAVAPAPTPTPTTAPAPAPEPLGRARSRFGAGPSAVVLANFELQQTGTQLRIVDVDDGSVYDGQVVTNTVVRLNEALAERELNDTKLKAEAKQDDARKEKDALSKAVADSTAVQLQSARGWNFRVSGVNRTLREPVVLDGVLLTGSDAPTAKSPRRVAQPAAQPVTSNVRTTSSAVRFYRAQPLAQTPGQTAARGLTFTNAVVNGLATDSFAVQRVQGTLRIGTNLQAIDAYRAGK